VAVGVVGVHLADEHAIEVDPAFVEARCHPQLQVRVERVVLDRAIGCRVNLGDQLASLLDELADPSLYRD
jgi:hypothetical protein